MSYKYLSQKVFEKCFGLICRISQESTGSVEFRIRNMEIYKIKYNSAKLHLRFLMKTT